MTSSLSLAAGDVVPSLEPSELIDVRCISQFGPCTLGERAGVQSRGIVICPRTVGGRPTVAAQEVCS
jgi:hypothetical protein